MIVDDSASMRIALSDVIGADPGLDVIATAPDPYAAVELMRAGLPDVLVLDVEMPRMDGLTFLRKLMAQRPIPVVICSSRTPADKDLMIRAFEAGAVEAIGKPPARDSAGFRDKADRICDAIRAAAAARLDRRGEGGPRFTPPAALRAQPKLGADAVLPPAAPGAARRIPRTERVLCLGASTGGTEALRDVIAALPPDAPGVVVVQHMPPGFTAAFARRLHGCSAIDVKEAEDGDALRPGLALIAPGDRHLVLGRRGQKYYVSIVDGPPVSRHRPSVDVLFRSAAQAAGPNATAALMTGMGDDGAQGLLELRQAGAFTIAQDEATSVVFGMPKEAIARGAAEVVLPLHKLAAALTAPRAAGA